MGTTDANAVLEATVGLGEASPDKIIRYLQPFLGMKNGKRALEQAIGQLTTIAEGDEGEATENPSSNKRRCLLEELAHETPGNRARNSPGKRPGPGHHRRVIAAGRGFYIEPNAIQNQKQILYLNIIYSIMRICLHN